MKLDNVTRDDWIVGGLALLLAICLLVLPWFDITVGVAGRSAMSATARRPTPRMDGSGFWRSSLLLAVIADLAVERLSPQTRAPRTRQPDRHPVPARVHRGGLRRAEVPVPHSLQPVRLGVLRERVVTAALVYFAAQGRSAVATDGDRRPPVPLRRRRRRPVRAEPPAGVAGRSTPPPGS